MFQLKCNLFLSFELQIVHNYCAFEVYSADKALYLASELL